MVIGGYAWLYLVLPGYTLIYLVMLGYTWLLPGYAWLLIVIIMCLGHNN